MTINISIVILGILMAASPTAACTPLDNMTPIAGATISVQSGDCAGNITILNNDVTIIVQSGAEPFQSGKSIVLPITGVIVNFTLKVTNVDWAVSQKLFSGGDASNLELQGASIEFEDSRITSTVSDPIGLRGNLTTSRYTVNTSTVSVTTSGSGVELSGAISGSSTVTVSSSTISVTGRSGDCYGLRLSGAAFADSNLDIRDKSQLTVTSRGYNGAYSIYITAAFTNSTVNISGGSNLTATNSHHWAVAIYTVAPFTNSTLVMTHGSVVQVTSANYYATAIRFVAAFIDSTVVMTHGSVVQASSTYNAYAIRFDAFTDFFDAAFTNSTLVMTHGSVVQVTSGNFDAYAISFYGASTGSTISISGGSQVTATGYSTAYTTYFGGVDTFTRSKLSVSGSNLTATSKAEGDAYTIYFCVFTDSTVDIRDKSTIVANGGSRTTAVYFSASGSVTRPSITIANSVVQSSYYSFRSDPDAFVNNSIGNITLCSSNFSGRSDGIGPLTGSTIQKQGVGTLTIGTIYWNSATHILKRAILLLTYTSDQLTIKSECVTESPTLEPTQQPTEPPTEPPTQQPTGQPTQQPTQEPTGQPTGQPVNAAVIVIVVLLAIFLLGALAVCLVRKMRRGAETKSLLQWEERRGLRVAAEEKEREQRQQDRGAKDLKDRRDEAIPEPLGEPTPVDSAYLREELSKEREERRFAQAKLKILEEGMAANIQEPDIVEGATGSSTQEEIEGDHDASTHLSTSTEKTGTTFRGPDTEGTGSDVSGPIATPGMKQGEWRKHM